MTRLVTATDAATFLRRYHQLRVCPATIRQWAARKHITSHSVTSRARYDLAELEAFALRTGRIAQ